MSDTRTEASRARGLGASGEGTTHFWRQRLTAIANIPLSMFAAATLIICVHADFDTARAFVGHPACATLIFLFFISALIHMRLGMQTIIEDYVHTTRMRVLAHLANTFFTIAIAATAALAVFRILFAA